MGPDNLFIENAVKLGIDLGQVDLAVLSHGHYDHGGALAKFLEVNNHAPVYLSEKAFRPYYHGPEKYIGLDVSLKGNERLCMGTAERAELEYATCLSESAGSNIGQMPGKTMCQIPGRGYVIGQGLTLYSCNRCERKYNLGSFGLSMVAEDSGGQKETREELGKLLIPDDFTHEQYLLIEENGKRVLISGCSHKGILDIAEWFEPDVLVGGFHFSKLPLDETLAGYARQLAEHDTLFITCHCTGREQYEYMKKYMPRLEYLCCGESFVIS